MLLASNLVASNVPVLAAPGFAGLVLIAVLAWMAISKRYTLAMRFFGSGSPSLRGHDRIAPTPDRTAARSLTRTAT